MALVSPHAGIMYSGRVAAAGYRWLEPTAFDTAVLVGPSHFVPFPGASVYPAGAFETPLGSARVDEELAAAVVSRGRHMRCQVEPHEREHSLEMQLPFIQVLAPHAAIVPILMGAQAREYVDDLASALAEAVRAVSRRALLVASSDLSHYLPASIAARLDGRVCDRIDAFDPDGLMHLLETDPQHACGGGPVVCVMKAARALGATASRVEAYGDSGDVTGDKSGVVGYVSAGLWG